MIKKIIAITFLSMLPVVLFVLITSKSSIGNISLRSFVVMSGSMEPTLPVGSVVFTRVQDTYVPGDIIAFQRNGETVTHRIVQKNIASDIFAFTTKGDANNVADEKAVTQNNVIGKEFFAIPFIGRFLVFIKTIPGFILCIVTPGLIFIGFEVWSIKEEFEKEIEKKVLKRMQEAA